MHGKPWRVWLVASPLGAGKPLTFFYSVQYALYGYRIQSQHYEYELSNYPRPPLHGQHFPTLCGITTLHHLEENLKVVGNEKGGGTGGWLLFKDGSRPWRSMSV
jgi:hypothetical protein